MQNKMKKLKEEFPFLTSIKPVDEELLEKVSIWQTVSKGKLLTTEGDSCSYFSFVISGTIRVYKLGESGREITLYRLNKGEACILTASCILSDSRFPAIAVTETDIEAVGIPSSLFKNWMDEHEYWRHFTFDLLAQRLAEIISVVDEIAFRHIDARLATRILQLYDRNGNPVKITHQKLASEIGSSREVITRILKDFEEKGDISTARGTIKVLNLQSLQSHIPKS
jgi:CRP/FNR family transcriptional regulator